MQTPLSLTSHHPHIQPHTQPTKQHPILKKPTDLTHPSPPWGVHWMLKCSQMLPGGGPFAPKPAGKIDQPICINTTLVLAHFSKDLKERSRTFVVHWVQLHIGPQPPTSTTHTAEAAEAEAAEAETTEAEPAGFEAADAKAINFQISAHFSRFRPLCIFFKKGVE